MFGRGEFGIVERFDFGGDGLEEDVGDGFGVVVDAADARDEISTVAFEIDGVFFELVVFVFASQDGFESVVPSGSRVEEHRAAHDVAVSREDFGEGGDDNVGKGEDVHVEPVADGFVDDDGEVVFVGQSAETGEVRGCEEGVAREFAEEGEKAFSLLEARFEIV